MVLEHVAGELRAGGSVPLALALAAPVRPRGGPAHRRCSATGWRWGRAWPRSLAAWRRDTADRDDDLAGRCASPRRALAVVERTGGPGADALDAVARPARPGRGRRRGAGARHAGARVGAARHGRPPAHLGLAGATGSGGVAELVGTRAGRTCLVVGLALLVVAHRWMRRIVEQAA